MQIIPLPLLIVFLPDLPPHLLPMFCPMRLFLFFLLFLMMAPLPLTHQALLLIC